MKNIVKLSIGILVMLAGLVCFSCTDGYFLGEGGGELIILNIPAEYNDNYLTVLVNIGSDTYTFGPANNTRIIIKSGRASGPLYKGGVQYTDTPANPCNINASIFTNATGGTEIEMEILPSITINGGGAVAYWPVE